MAGTACAPISLPTPCGRTPKPTTHKSFTATLHRLRRLLGTEEALLLRDARLSMNRSLLWVDTWALEQTLAELDETLRAPAPASLDVAAKLMDESCAIPRPVPA